MEDRKETEFTIIGKPLIGEVNLIGATFVTPNYLARLWLYLGRVQLLWLIAGI